MSISSSLPTLHSLAFDAFFYKTKEDGSTQFQFLEDGATSVHEKFKLYSHVLSSVGSLVPPYRMADTMCNMLNSDPVLIDDEVIGSVCQTAHYIFECNRIHPKVANRVAELMANEKMNPRIFRLDVLKIQDGDRYDSIREIEVVTESNMRKDFTYFPTTSDLNKIPEALRNLQCFRADQFIQFDGEMCKIIGRMHHLTELDVHLDGQQGIVEIAKLVHLVSLKIYIFPEITDDFFVTLSSLQELKVLELETSRSEDGKNPEQFHYITRLTNLVDLSLARFDLDDANLLSISQLNKLESFHNSFGVFTDNGIQMLNSNLQNSSLSNLRDLKLLQCKQITKASFRIIANFPVLSSLTITGIENLRVEDCEDLFRGNCQLTELEARVYDPNGSILYRLYRRGNLEHPPIETTIQNFQERHPKVKMRLSYFD